MANKQVEQPEKTTMIPTLTPETQALVGLQNVMNAIAGLQQYAGTVLPADALGRLRDAAAYLKQTSQKAENYNAAWFGEQALKALNQKRPDIAMFAVTIGLGGGMDELSEQDRKQVAGIITQNIKPADTRLSRLIIKLEIASTQALVETIKKDFGGGVAQRVAGATTESLRRLGVNDEEGAAKLIFMARVYLGLVMVTKNQKWAGRTEMEQALDLEISRKDGVAIFNKGAEYYQLELQRQAVRLQLQQLGDSIDQMKKQVAELDKYSQFMAKQRLAPMEAKLAVMEKWLGTMTSTADFSATTVIKGKKTLSFMDELAGLLSEADKEGVIYRTSNAITKQAEMNAEDVRRAGGDKEVLFWLKKADGSLEKAQQSLQGSDFAAARKEFFAAMENKAMALALYSTPKRVARPRDEEAEAFQLPKLAEYRKMAGELFDLLTGRPLDPEAAMERANTLEKAIWLVNTTIMCIPPRVSYMDKQDAVLGLIGQGKLDKAYDAMREMDQAARDYIRVTNGIMMAVGIGSAFIPKVGPFISTAIFASMATDNILTEYRENDHVSVQAWAWAGISVLPLVGWAGKSSQVVRMGTSSVMSGAALYGGYGTYKLYDAWAKETDPYTRHQLLSDALYNTLFLAPAAIYLGLRAPAGYKYLKGATQEMYYAFQEMSRLPSKAELAGVTQPFRTVGYGAKGTVQTKTGTGGFVEETVVQPQQKQSFFKTATRRVISKLDELRGSRKGKLQPPNMDEFLTAAGKDLGATMASKPKQMAYAMTALYDSIVGKMNVAECRQAMTTIYADETLRASLTQIAQTDGKLAQALSYIEGKVRTSYESTQSMKAGLQTISNETRVDGIPKGQMEVILVSSERYSIANNNDPLIASRFMIGNMTVVEEAGILGTLRTKTMKVQVGKKTDEVPIVNDVILQNAYGQIRFSKTQADVLAIKTGSDPVMRQIKANLASTAATEADIDAALLAAMKNKNVIDIVDKTYGKGTGNTYSKALEGGLNTVLGDGPGALEGQLKQLLINVRNNQALAEDIQATHILGQAVKGITQTAITRLEENARADETSTVVGAVYGTGRRFLKWAFIDMQTFGPKAVMASPGTRTVLGIKRATFSGKNMVIMGAQLGVWWLEWRQAAWPASRGIYNLITGAATAEQGRADAKRDFGVDISSENAKFIRSEAGKQFYLLGISRMFPVGEERRPTTPQKFEEMLKAPGIILEPSRLNGILDDGRQMEGELGTINRLLKTGRYDELGKLLKGMGIDADAARRIYESKKSLDLADMADLRRNDWLAKGYVYGYKEVIANTICSDAGVGEDVRTLDANRINSLLMDKGEAARTELEAMLGGVNLTLDNIAGLLKEKGRRTLVADDLQQLAEIAKANAVRFLCNNTGEFRSLWEDVRSGNLPVVWFGSAIAQLNSGGQLADAGLYLSVPIKFDSFLSRLDERATMDPKFRQGFLGLLDRYKNNGAALARFNEFTLAEGEEVYGNAFAIAANIAATGNGKDELARARSDGRVAAALLVEIEPGILDNVPLLKLIRNKSRLNESGSLTEDEGIYAWIVGNQNRISDLVAILNELNGRQVIRDSRPFDIYDPAGKKGQLVDLEEYFEGKGWLKPRTAKAEALLPAIGKGTVSALKWTFVPTRKEELTKEEKEAAGKREEELKRTYPPKGMLRPERYATETDETATGAPVVSANVNAALEELVRPEYLERAKTMLANAAEYQAVLESEGEGPAQNKYGENTAEYRDYRSVVKQAGLQMTLGENGAITAISAQNTNRAKNALDAVLRR